MKILFPDIHKTLTTNMAKVFKILGHEMIVASSDYKITHYPPPPVQQWLWDTTRTQEFVTKEFGDNVLALNKQQILDIKPDVIVISNYECQFELINEIWNKLDRKPKLVFYAGNLYWPEAFCWNICQNYLMADLSGYQWAKERNKHTIHYFPYIDYNELQFGGVSDKKLIGSYIADYPKNFPKEWEYVKILEKVTPFVEHKFCLNNTQSEVYDIMRKSMATIHVKPIDGFGYSSVQSLAIGRPIFCIEKYTVGKTYEKWLLDGQTAFFFKNAQEYHDKLKYFIDNQEFRREMQIRCSKMIREIVNNDIQTASLKNFLENLR